MYFGSRRAFSIVFVLPLLVAMAIGEEPKPPSGFAFTREKMIDHTSVKNQARTNTCWCFATNSFLEAELLRMGKGPIDLSEMYVVRNIYPMKADLFVRRHGDARFAAGGLTNNVLHCLRNFGVCPESAYPGRVDGRPHDQYELDRILKAMLTAVVESNEVNPAWRAAVDGTLDAYLGKLPKSFSYEGVNYTPQQFANHLGLNAEDYVQLTSYSHHPFYRKVRLEIPDNWAMDEYWNVPLDDFVRTMKHAIEKGYTFTWDGDISERSCLRDDGVAILPAKPWWQRTRAERNAIGKAPEPELDVTQELRQTHFDSFATTDDHLMHGVGNARDQLGNYYLILKDSYGTMDHKNQGFVNMSEAYLRSKTVTILLHKNGLPDDISARLMLSK